MVKKKKNTTMTQTEFAKLCGVSLSAIGKAIRTGLIPKKIVNGRAAVDFGSEITKAYLEKQKANIDDRTKYTPKTKAQRARWSDSANANPLKDIDAALDAALNTSEPKRINLTELQRQKVEEEIKKIKADRRLKELKYEEEKGRLIEKETLGSVLFEYLNALNINILDLAESTYDTVKDMVLGGSSRGEIVKYQRDSAKRFVVDTKSQIEERLK